MLSVAHDTDAEAVAWHNATLNQRGLHFYTDGSGIQGTTSAAALLWEERESKAWRVAQLGPLSQFSVFCGEAKGLLMVLEMARDEDFLCKVFVYTDNKGLIQAIDNPVAKTAQHFLREFHRIHSQFPCHVTISWIPAHIGIPGNEMVDQLAKEAAGWRPTPPRPILTLIVTLRAITLLPEFPKPLANVGIPKRANIAAIQTWATNKWIGD